MATDSDVRTKLKQAYSDLKQEGKEERIQGLIMAVKLMRPDMDVTKLFEEAKSDMSANLAEARTEDDMFNEYKNKVMSTRR